MIWDNLPFEDRIRVTHVCHDWRALALAASSFWQSIAVGYHCELKPASKRDDDGCSSKRRGLWDRDPLDALLKRSGSPPLSVTFTLTGCHVACTVCTRKMVASRVAKDISRLAKLVFMMDNKWHVARLIVALGGSFPALRELKVNSLYGVQDRRREDQIDFNARGGSPSNTTKSFHAPELCALSMSANIGWFPTDITVSSMLHITRLKLRPTTNDDIARALLACPNIVHLDLDLRYYAVTRPPSVDLAPLTDGINGTLKNVEVWELKAAEIGEPGFVPLWSFITHPSRKHFHVALLPFRSAFGAEAEAAKHLGETRVYSMLADLTGALRLDFDFAIERRYGLVKIIVEQHHEDARPSGCSRILSCDLSTADGLWDKFDVSRVVELRTERGLPDTVIALPELRRLELERGPYRFTRCNWRRTIPSGTHVIISRERIPQWEVDGIDAFEEYLDNNPLAL